METTIDEEKKEGWILFIYQVIFLLRRTSKFMKESEQRIVNKSLIQ